MQTAKEISSHASTAKAIRQELKNIFPAVKFSVTSESFSMGDAVRIRWTDGPTVEQVEKITGKYQYGTFNGMEDMYESTNCRDDIPQTKYVSTRRDFSEEAKQDMCQKLGIEWSEYNYLNQERGDYNYSIVRRALWDIDFTNTAIEDEPETEPENRVETVGTKDKTFITVTFPQANKNNSLLENFEAMVMYGMNDERCLVQKTVELEKYLFDGVSNSLLENRPEMWEQIGGSTSDDPIFAGCESYEQFCIMLQDPKIRKIYQDTCYTNVIEVKEKDGYRSFYVNTEGYDYARYVGVITCKNRKED